MGRPFFFAGDGNYMLNERESPRGNVLVLHFCILRYNIQCELRNDCIASTLQCSNEVRELSEIL